MLGLKFMLNLVAALFGLVAGILWFKSATASAKHRPGLSALTIGDMDIYQTALAQSRRNAKAAIAQAAAILLQV